MRKLHVKRTVNVGYPCEMLEDSVKSFQVLCFKTYKTIHTTINNFMKYIWFLMDKENRIQTLWTK
jgi:hypothetical protein